ncbi:MAG: SHOCT domain-containing protein [Nitrospinaceae bacterium]|nr:SHOCT domain-containing protein [Nitrospinaceae bacterium]
MKHHLYWTFILIAVLVSGLLSGCASTKEKKLQTKGFTLSYKDKSSAGSSVNKMQLNHPLKISETAIRNYLRSLVFEELSLFGKKKPVFLSHDIDRIGRLLTKAIQRVSSRKIIHYELETPQGATSGDIFASKKYIHWRFDSIKGMGFTGRSKTGWGNVNWRMVPQPGQKYQVVQKLLGTEAQENWVFTELQPSSKRQKNARQKNLRSGPSKSRTVVPSREQANNRPSPSKGPNLVLEEKLEFLKDLHEKNLVDEKEYNQKRKELLDTYL